MKMKDNNQLVLEIPSLPDISREEADFLDTSFFQSNGASSSHPRLPTPTEISRDPSHNNRKVVIFKSLNLAVKVKHKSTIKLEEVQAMIAIRRAFPNGEVPVPEVFGWRQHNEKIYIYQSLAAGISLKQAWPSLTKAEKFFICGELSKVVEALRRLKQDTPHPFIGTATSSAFHIHNGANSSTIVQDLSTVGESRTGISTLTRKLDHCHPSRHSTTYSLPPPQTRNTTRAALHSGHIGRHSPIRETYASLMGISHPQT
jgi:hypothetical protein